MRAVGEGVGSVARRTGREEHGPRPRLRRPGDVTDALRLDRAGSARGPPFCGCRAPVEGRWRGRRPGPTLRGLRPRRRVRGRGNRGHPLRRPRRVGPIRPCCAPRRLTVGRPCRLPSRRLPVGRPCRLPSRRLRPRRWAGRSVRPRSVRRRRLPLRPPRGTMGAAGTRGRPSCRASRWPAVSTPGVSKTSSLASTVAGGSPAYYGAWRLDGIAAKTAPAAPVAAVAAAVARPRSHRAGRSGAGRVAAGAARQARAGHRRVRQAALAVAALRVDAARLRRGGRREARRGVASPRPALFADVAVRRPPYALLLQGCAPRWERLPSRCAPRGGRLSPRW